MIDENERRREPMTSSARTVTFPSAVSPRNTLFPLRRGPGDPCFQIGADGAIWRTSLLHSGSVTARLTRAAANAVDCTAWGSGAEEYLDGLPALLGALDDASDFQPIDPIVAEAQLLKATVVKEVRATYSIRPQLDRLRPTAPGPWPRTFLAGDWVATGWPATMEGAVRSGYLAAEALSQSAGSASRFLKPDLAPGGLMRLLPR